MATLVRTVLRFVKKWTGNLRIWRDLMSLRNGTLCDVVIQSYVAKVQASSLVVQVIIIQ